MLGLNPRRLFYIAILVVIILLARQYVPPYFARFQYGDDVRQTVKYAAAQHMGPDAVKAELLRLAEEDGVPVGPENITITVRGYSLYVDVNYTWPIDLRFHKYDLKFHISESGENFGGK
jgi:hypothetical protein